MNNAAVILSAGESRRMGRPKACLPFRGGTFLSHIAGTLGEFASPVIAVFGYNAAELSRLAPSGVVTVENPNYAQGMLTSLQAGLRAVPAECDRVFFTLVDHPAVTPATVDLLAATNSPIAIPRYRGKRGHPVLIRRAIAEEFLAEPVTNKIRDVIDRRASEILYLDVDDSGINEDIDDPERYRSLMARETAPETDMESHHL